MPGGFVTDVPISRPMDLRVERHRDMGGFSWNADEGLFIPVDDLTSDMFELPPDVEAGGDQ